MGRVWLGERDRKQGKDHPGSLHTAFYSPRDKRNQKIANTNRMKNKMLDPGCIKGMERRYKCWTFLVSVNPLVIEDLVNQ